VTYKSSPSYVFKTSEGTVLPPPFQFSILRVHQGRLKMGWAGTVLQRYSTSVISLENFSYYLHVSPSMNVNMKHTSKHLQFPGIQQKFSQNHHVL